MTTEPKQYRLHGYFCDVVEFVSREFKLSPLEVMGRTREVYPVHARWTVWYILCYHRVPYSAVGRIARNTFGNRWDHGTVINGFRRIRFILQEQTNDPLDKQVRAVIRAWMEKENEYPVKIVLDNPPPPAGGRIPGFRPFMAHDVRLRQGRAGATEAGSGEACDGTGGARGECPGAEGDADETDVLGSESGRRTGQVYLHTPISDFDPITRTGVAGGNCRNTTADDTKEARNQEA